MVCCATPYQISNMIRKLNNHTQHYMSTRLPCSASPNIKKVSKTKLFTRFRVNWPAAQHLIKYKAWYENHRVYSMSCQPACVPTCCQTSNTIPKLHDLEHFVSTVPLCNTLPAIRNYRTTILFTACPVKRLALQHFTKYQKWQRTLVFTVFLFNWPAVHSPTKYQKWCDNYSIYSKWCHPACFPTFRQTLKIIPNRMIYSNWPAVQHPTKDQK